MADVAVIILTYNEERNIEQALRSVCGWAKEVFVLDSFSSDATLDIAARFPCTVVQNKFIDYSDQRNHALQRLPITASWTFFLDADEWVPAALQSEIAARATPQAQEDGFFVNRRLIWMGRWIKRGYYPTWILRLFRTGRGRCESRQVNEHIIVEGEVGRLEHDLMHEDHKSVTEWVTKHNRYATAEAAALLDKAKPDELEGRLLGAQAERKRWIRERVWNHLPVFVRPAAYFGYRYFLRGGFLDGPEAFAYHVLQGLWFQTLVDVKYVEMRRGRDIVEPRRG